MGGTPTPTVGHRLAGLQLALFVGLGLPEGALGVAWPAMRATFHQGRASLGVVLAAGTVGYLAASTLTGRLLRRPGPGRLAAGAATLAAAALLVETGAPAWSVLVAAALVLGLARGAIDGGLNAVVAEHGGVRRLGLMHAGFGVGTTIAPLVVVALATAGWRAAWSALTVLGAGLALWAWAARATWPAVGAPPVGPTPAAPLPAPPLTPGPLTPGPPTTGPLTPAPSPQGPVTRVPPRVVVGLTLVAFAAYVGAEVSTGTWAYTLLVGQRGMAHGAAGVAVAGFWAGLTAGRFLLWGFGERIPGRVLLGLAAVGAGLSLLWLWADPGGAGWVGLPVAGLAMAPVFPTLMSLTPERVSLARAGTVIGWSVAAASLGGTALSAAAGALPLAPTLVAYGVLLGLALLALDVAAAPSPPA